MVVFHFIQTVILFTLKKYLLVFVTLILFEQELRMNSHFILFGLSFYFVRTKMFVRNTYFVQTVILYCSKSFSLNNYYILFKLFCFNFV